MKLMEIMAWSNQDITIGNQFEESIPLRSYSVDPHGQQSSSCITMRCPSCHLSLNVTCRDYTLLHRIITMFKEWGHESLRMECEYSIIISRLAFRKREYDTEMVLLQYFCSHTLFIINTSNGIPNICLIW